jgi:hypothetical protein
MARRGQFFRGARGRSIGDPRIWGKSSFFGENASGRDTAFLGLPSASYARDRRAAPFALDGSAFIFGITLEQSP